MKCRTAKRNSRRRGALRLGGCCVSTGVELLFEEANLSRRLNENYSILSVRKLTPRCAIIGIWQMPFPARLTAGTRERKLMLQSIAFTLCLPFWLFSVTFFFRVKAGVITPLFDRASLLTGRHYFRNYPGFIGCRNSSGTNRDLQGRARASCSAFIRRLGQICLAGLEARDLFASDNERRLRAR